MPNPYTAFSDSRLRPPNPFLRQQQPSERDEQKPNGEPEPKPNPPATPPPALSPAPVAAKPRSAFFRRNNQPPPPSVVEPLPVPPPKSAPRTSPPSVLLPVSPPPQSTPRTSPPPVPYTASQLPPPPVPPQSAVEIFKNINNSLPDGVQYEPLDKETLRLLKEAEGLRQNPAASSISVAHPQNISGVSRDSETHSTPAPPTPPQSISGASRDSEAHSTQAAPTQSQSISGASREHDDDDGGLVESLMQDERNAKIFYSHLAGKAPRPDVKAAMQGLANGCAVRLKDYGEILRKSLGRSFAPKETEINTSINFRDGVALALTEENKSIRAITEWMDGQPDAYTERILQNIINKKNANYNLLSLIYSNLDFPFKF